MGSKAVDICNDKSTEGHEENTETRHLANVRYDWHLYLYIGSIKVIWSLEALAVVHSSSPNEDLSLVICSHMGTWLLLAPFVSICD